MVNNFLGYLPPATSASSTAMPEMMNKTEDLFNSYRYLKNTIFTFLDEKNKDEFKSQEFENLLRKYKQNFFSLLQNMPKNAKSREELRKGLSEGVMIKGLGQQILSQELYQETLILSDMFDLNEFAALDLLCTAQINMCQYPELPRGLVAVLLYYEGRKCLVTTLRYLVQARLGHQWTVATSGTGGERGEKSLHIDAQKFITNYTDQLEQEGDLFMHIFNLLRTLDLSKELEKLHENLALGDAKHKYQVITLFEDIRVILADIVFTWASQCGLPKGPTLALIAFLRDTELQHEASGKFDTVTLYLQMALLSAFDLSVLHTREDGEACVQRIPILADREYIPAIVAEMLPDSSQSSQWRCEGMRAVSMFALAVCVATLRILPQGVKLHESLAHGKDEEQLIDTAIACNVFEFLHDSLLENELIYREQFLYKRLHYLLTDFILHMYPKVKELRIKADDISRTVQIYGREGLNAPASLPHHFEHLLLTISKLYASDRLATEYALDYWSPLEIPNSHNSSTVAGAGTGGGSVGALMATKKRSNAGGSVTSSPRSVALFRFVRLAGDALPPTLFVAYIKMLAGLSHCPAAARHCFNLLKVGSGSAGSTTQNGAFGGGSMPAATAGCTLSWDKFFTSFAQYYTNLRQELPPTGDTIYRNTYLKCVTPHELEGLHAVLGLIRSVAAQDEFARLALCEHPNWAPLTILLGLIGCAIPIPLKADLLRTLAQLIRNQENAAQMWENLESSQILVTVPTTSSYAPRGLLTELEEIESRLEEYPLTGAFLELLDTLTDYAIPCTLGAGPRPPGFDPYLNFILNSVFLKFKTRAYRTPAEKWRIAEACLKLLDKFLAQYDPQLGDFAGGASGQHQRSGGAAETSGAGSSTLGSASTSSINSPPGYHLMVYLNNKTELLSLILDVIDEGGRVFETYTTPSSTALRLLVERTTLHCLRILSQTLAILPKFQVVLNRANSPMLLTSLARLLLTINPRTNTPDYCLTIAQYMNYQPLLIRHVSVALKILLHVTGTAQLHAQFIDVLLTSGVKDKIRYGVVQCLDGVVVAGETADDEKDDDQETIVKNKLEILRLLKQCLRYNSGGGGGGAGGGVNLTHFLMGFDVRRDISKTEFQYPGVMNTPRSCLHSIITLIEQEILKDSSAHSSILENAYELLYILSSNGRTAGPILRFLRLDKDFFIHHLSHCRKRQQNDTTNTINVLNQIGFLLKILAVELKCSSTNKQISHLRPLLRFLVNLPKIDSQTDKEQQQQQPQQQQSNNETSNYSVLVDNSETLFGLNVDDETAPLLDSNTALIAEITHNNFLIDLIPFFEYKKPGSAAVRMPEWQFFDKKVLTALIETCVSSDSRSGLIDLKKLHQKLYDELKLLQGTAVFGHIQSVSQEIPKVLRYALDLNKNKEKYASNVNFVDAWRQCVEMIVVFVPNEVLETRDLQLVALSVALRLLEKVHKQQLLAEVARLLSGCVVLILDKVRKLHDSEVRNGKLKNDETARVARQRQAAGAVAGIAMNTTPILYTHRNLLHDILDQLIEWFLVASVTDQKLRINLYGALAILLDFEQSVETRNIVDLGDLDRNETTFVSRLDSSRVEFRRSVKSGVPHSRSSLDVVNKFGKRLVEVMCQDCTGGYELTKMLALNCFSTLIALSGNVDWIIYINGRGYLKFLIQKLVDSNDDLERILEPPASTLNQTTSTQQTNQIVSLYSFMSTVLFIGRLMCTRIGAEMLLENNLYASLANMNVFNYHPDLHNLTRNTVGQSGLTTSYLVDGSFQQYTTPPAAQSTNEQIYQQMWLPTLELCNATLTTVGTTNQSAIIQIMHFVFSHADVVELILRTSTPLSSALNLKEVSLLTRVLARCANNDLANVLENTTIAHHNQRVQLYRLQKLLLAMLPRFTLTDWLARELQGNSYSADSEIGGADTGDGNEEKIGHVLQIIVNLLTYARNVVANHGVQHGGVAALFQPSLKDAATASSGGGGGGASLNADGGGGPTLGAIVHHLVATVAYYHREKFTWNMLRRRLSEVATFNENALQELVGEDFDWCWIGGGYGTVDLEAKREYVYGMISSRMAAKRKELDCCFVIVEHAVHLIWMHLDHYMLKAIPTIGKKLAGGSAGTRGNLASSTELTWRLTAEDVSGLKHGLVNIFNDSFTKQILEIFQAQPDLNKGFVDTLLKKIIRLIQFVPVK